MQPATCTDLHVRSVSDAVLIMHAVAIGKRAMVTRRLDTEARNNIKSGNVYVWEERGPHTDVTGIGIERWTDGIGWGPSRVRDGFLFYTQKIHPHQHHLYSMNPRSPYSDPNFDPAFSALTKQTYTAHVKTRHGKRKWHLIAYYVQEKIEELHTIDDYPDLCNLEVPIENYSSARAPKGRPDRITIQARPGRSASVTSPTGPSPTSYMPYSQAYRNPPSRQHSTSPTSTSSSQEYVNGSRDTRDSTAPSLPTLNTDLGGGASVAKTSPTSSMYRAASNLYASGYAPSSAVPRSASDATSFQMRSSAYCYGQTPSERPGSTRALPPLEYNAPLPSSRDSLSEAQINRLPEHTFFNRDNATPRISHASSYAARHMSNVYYPAQATAATGVPQYR